jgi:hypothetical protein
MAKQNNIQDTSQTIPDQFIKGLNKDSDPSFVAEGMWTHAVNAVNNTLQGDVGTISNEASNYLCGITGNTMPAAATNRYIIGTIYLFSDKWIIFTAGHSVTGQRISSEIGLFEEDICSYREIVQDSCLNFDKRYLISGSSREKEDCSWQVYWADGFNPDRYLNVGDPKTWPDPAIYSWLGTPIANPTTVNYYVDSLGNQILWPGVQWREKCTPAVPCITCVDENILDCPKTRLARLMETPCLNLTLGQSGGTLANGTYFVLIAYTIKGQKVTDFFSQSNFQFIYNVNDLEGSLTIDVNADSENFDEFVLVIVEATNQQTVATQMGSYSTSTSRIAIDQINPSNVKVPLEQLPIQTPVFETSDQITDVNNYLLKAGPRSKFDFNYQPLANLIRTRWASVEYPADYYMKGGSKTNYLRDEVYTFYIRWVYDTGDKSASYHIPGRGPIMFQVPGGISMLEDDNFLVTHDQNALAIDDSVFEVYNTATQGLPPTTLPNATLVNGQWVLDDGGILLATGAMGYWQSTEIYADNRPDIWNPSYYCWTGPAAQIPPGQTEGPYDLCGKHIRHHKFPENFINNSATTDALHFLPNPNTSIAANNYNIRLMGVFFSNIILPKDQNGIDIPDIAGYEILRGSREGNKTIIAKGMVNNFRTFKLTGSLSQNRTGLYGNYPYNTIIPIGSSTNSGDHNYQYNDPYIKNMDNSTVVKNQDIPTDVFTFHSPDTMFRTPFLSTTEFKVYGTLNGYSDMAFKEPAGHPQWKLLADGVVIPILLAGLTEAIISLVGKRTQNTTSISGGALTSAATPGPADAALAAQISANATLAGVAGGYNIFWNGYYGFGGGSIADALTMISPIAGGYSNTQLATQENTLLAAINSAAAAGAVTPATIEGSIILPDFAYLDPFTRSLGALNQISFYFSEGADIAVKLFYLMTSYKQYALQQISHGYYSNMVKLSISNLNRFSIEDSFYIRDNIQEVSPYQDNTGTFINYTINNLRRSDAVVIRTESGPYYNLAYPNGVTIGPNLITTGLTDKSLVTLGTVVQNSSDPAFISNNLPNFDGNNFTTPFSTSIASHYGGLKGRVRNQYGQIGSEFQIVITPCEQRLSNYNVPVTNWTCPIDNTLYTFRSIVNTPIFFGGDTYINRYTEKNNMMFYFDWLYGQPDGFEYNYYLHSMIPNPRFSVNSIAYDVNNISELFNAFPSVPGIGAWPGTAYNLDYYVNINRYYNYEDDTDEGVGVSLPNLNLFKDTYKGLFSVREAYFYLANSGIRDFFVESEVLIDFRKQSTRIGGKHYDPYRYTDYEAMFNMNPDIMGVLSEYIYDYSLSVSKLYNQYFSSGSTQSRYYDPNVAKLCYTYYPDRIVYSLPQQDEAIKDSWFVYLINNYKEFKSQISGVKAINKSGLLLHLKMKVL